MTLKDNRKPETYKYSVGSLFGPRSLKDHILLNEGFNKTQLKRSEKFDRYEKVDNPDYDLKYYSRVRVERQADLEGTASGYGDYYCPEGIPVETALLALLGAFGLAFGALFRAITLKTGGRRKKRSTWELANSTLPNLYIVYDLIWSGR